jgi:predicted CXXCH cytochrome family protein
VGFVPGAELEASYEVIRPVPGQASELFWPDGTERLPFMEYQGFVQSGHYRVGLTCTTCHLPHGSDNPRGLRRRTSDLCVGCHGEVLGAVRAHQAHPSGGADCVDCHMTPVAGGPGALRVRTHTFRFLDPTRSQDSGMPSSCAGSCHAGRDARWAAQAMERWR